MKKFLKIVVVSLGVAACAGTTFAADEKPVEAEQETTSPFAAGFSFDFFSAYVWRNAIVNDRMVMQPCVWADLTAFDPFTVGFSVWQNYDVTDRRRATYKHALSETDYNVHAGYSAWSSEDGSKSLNFEVGHDWYTYQGVRRAAKGDSPDTRELYLKGRFANPVADVYGQASWMYEDFGDYKGGFHYEIGFNREYELCDFLTLGADWNVNFADEDYTHFLYGTDTYGFGGTTIKFYLDWAITDWATLGGTIAYTGLLNASSRDELKGSDYDRDFIWGGFSLRLEF